MVIELEGDLEKPSCPFKLNPLCLEDGECVQLLKNAWNPFDINLRELKAIQF